MPPSFPTNLFYTLQGQGDPIVLVHGLGSSLHEWDTVIPALAGAGYQSIACDLLGHGNSPKPKERREYTFQSIYNHWVDWVNGLKLAEPFCLAGHSLGGYLCLSFAMMQPDRLKSLLLIDPLYSLDQIPRLVRNFPALIDLGQLILHTAPRELLIWAMRLPGMPTAALPLKVQQQRAVEMKSANPAVSRLIRSLEPLMPQPALVKLPVLVVWGDHDRSLSPRSFPRLIESLPNAQGLQVPGCGHHPHFEKPAEVNRAILDFLEKIKMRLP
jgi:pimeloyl-ACP methyl ester carboxylesterase